MTSTTSETVLTRSLASLTSGTSFRYHEGQLIVTAVHVTDAELWTLEVAVGVTKWVVLLRHLLNAVEIKFPSALLCVEAELVFS